MVNGTIKGKLRIAALMIVGSFLITGLLVYIPEEANGAEYNFETISEIVEVEARKDGKATIRYAFEFRNYGYGFDVVDIGMPNHKYHLSTATAKLTIKNSEGFTLRTNSDMTIKRSTYVYPGVEVHVNAGGENYIRLEFSIVCDWMVWESPENSNLASIQFRPTWFGSDYQRGATGTLTISLTLPVPYSHRDTLVRDKSSWDDIKEVPNGLTLTWYFRNMFPRDIESGDADVGVAFPKEHVDHYYKDTILVKAERFIHGIIAMIWMNPDVCCILFMVVFISSIVIIPVIITIRKPSDYFRPKISMPGAGPRTGLTAPEAAMVLELPLDRVTEMIVYGMVKKGIIRIVEPGAKVRMERVDPNKITMNYETDVYNAIHIDGYLDERKLKVGIEAMIKATEQKMRGFSQMKTKQYYKKIVSTAWDQVKECKDLEKLDQIIINNGEWLPLDKKYKEHMGLYVHPYFVGSHVNSSTMPGSMAPGMHARSFANSVNSISGSVVSSSTKFTRGIVNTLHPPPKGGSGGGFGGGGGCACACACACAGGGR